MWALPKMIVLILGFLANMGTEHDKYFSKPVSHNRAPSGNKLSSETSALLKTSDMVGTVLSRNQGACSRESNFARSDAEQRPDHAGRQYVNLARMVARNTSWSDSVEMP